MNLLFLTYPLITTALYHLGARAVITKPLWSRYPQRIDTFMSCAACSGFWYGIIIAMIGLLYGFPDLPTSAINVIWCVQVGLLSLVWTPILAAKHEQALEYLGGSITNPEPVPEHDAVTQPHPKVGDGKTSCIDCGRPWVSRSIAGGIIDEHWGKRCRDCADKIDDPGRG